MYNYFYCVGHNLHHCFRTFKALLIYCNLVPNVAPKFHNQKNTKILYALAENEKLLFLLQNGN